ncbi:MAG: DUF1795 domain-containing protein [candidate division Zixibacteria bacterium]|jgi:hypothetical protein|nr:DUF1795 domain-containing protein [candidate division Zixibacteria bacterium]
MSSANNISHPHLELPPGWIDETVYTFKGPDDSGVQHNLVLMIDKEAKPDDITAYAKQRIQTLAQTLQGFELLGEQPKKVKSGFDAYEAVYKWIPTEGKVIFQKQVYLIAYGVTYNFTASFSKKTIKTIGVEVDAIIDSFRPEPPATQ